MSYIQNKLDELLEILAEKEHDRWSHWQRYMHNRVYDSSESINPHLKVIPTEDYNRWERQLNTPYSELTEKEKDSDREQVKKYLPLIEQALTDYHNHIMKYLKANHIDYCIQQNGMPYCKNCGLDLTEMEHDLSLLQDTNPKEL